MKFNEVIRLFVEGKLKGLGCKVSLEDSDHKLAVTHDSLSKPETITQANCHDQHVLKVWVEAIKKMLSS